VGAPVVVLEGAYPTSSSNGAWLVNVLVGLNVVLAAFALVNRDRRPA
jgi:hypothetical protein